jgi:hypothetical protein
MWLWRKIGLIGTDFIIILCVPVCVVRGRKGTFDSSGRPHWTLITCESIDLNLYKYLHGADSFLKLSDSARYSRCSVPCMAREGSLPCLQEPVTGPYPVSYTVGLIAVPVFSLLRVGLQLSVVFWPTFLLISRMSRVQCALTVPSFDLIILIVFEEEWKSVGPSHAVIFHLVTSCLLGSDILLSTLFADILIYVLPLMWETNFTTQVK